MSGSVASRWTKQVTWLHLKSRSGDLHFRQPEAVGISTWEQLISSSVYHKRQTHGSSRRKRSVMRLRGATLLPLAFVISSSPAAVCVTLGCTEHTTGAGEQEREWRGGAGGLGCPMALAEDLLGNPRQLLQLSLCLGAGSGE